MFSFHQNWRKGQNRFCLEESGVGRWGKGGRNDPNNVCTYEYLNKEKNKNNRTIKKEYLAVIYIHEVHLSLQYIFFSLIIRR
jgi:hypothetical protein